MRRRMPAELHDWLAAREGIAHREEILHAGFGVALLRAFAASHARWIRRAWVATAAAPPDLVAAAEAGGRVSCISLARRRGWWMPDGIDPGFHLHLLPGAGSPRLPAHWRGTTHWTKPLAAQGRALLGSVEDALAHIAVCQTRDVALVLWESAARVERLAGESLRALPWPSRAARELALEVTGLSDSGLETILVRPLRRWGLSVRQQIVLAGKPVDVLIGERLVVQIDGYAFHSSSAQRSKDIAHDAELRLRGYTVLRFSYTQLIHEWAAVERTISRAVAARLHLAA